MPRHLGYNPTRQSDQRFEKRVMRLIFFLFLVIFILAVRLFYLQIVQHRYYLDQEEHNRSNLLAIEPSRGILYDRNGVILADNMSVYSLVITRDKVKNLQGALADLQTLLNVDPKAIQIFLKDLKNHPRFAPIPLVDRLTETQMASFMLNQYRFPGFSVQIRYIRHYPLGAALAPVTGYVSRINSKELANVDPNNYSASTNIGKVGIEKYFEKQLHGQIGFQRIAMDAYGRQVEELSNIPSIPGDNLTLTIDSRLQEVAYKAFNGSRGALVAIQPDTGQVLALVSSPSYDPNLFVGGIDTKTFRQLQDDPHRPLYNRPVRGLFPFGSTVKPFYALQGLETGFITPSSTVFDPGYFKLPGVKRVYHNWTWNVRHGGQGMVDVTRALEQSNDTFFFTLGMKLGPDRLATILQDFGFGQKTNIQIPEEVEGHLATPAWKKKNRHEQWYAGDTVAASIGQGYTITTPVQLAQGVARIATKGIEHPTSLLLKIQSPDGRIVPISTTDLSTIKIKPTTWNVVINGMNRVITVGTGSYHFGQKEFGKPVYAAAGKTGTAQVFNYKNKRYNKKDTPVDLRDNSLFIVFAPLDHPQIAMAVVQEHDENAGLIARQVVDEYLLHILAPPQAPSLPPEKKTDVALVANHTKEEEIADAPSDPDLTTENDNNDGADTEDGTDAQD